MGRGGKCPSGEEADLTHPIASWLEADGSPKLGNWKRDEQRNCLQSCGQGTGIKKTGRSPGPATSASPHPPQKREEEE